MFYKKTGACSKFQCAKYTENWKFPDLWSLNCSVAGSILNLMLAGDVCQVLCDCVTAYKNFEDDISLMIGKRPSKFWMVCWVGISPIITLVRHTPADISCHHSVPCESQARPCACAFVKGKILQIHTSFPLLACPGQRLKRCQGGNLTIIFFLYFLNSIWPVCHSGD